MRPGFEALDELAFQLLLALLFVYLALAAAAGLLALAVEAIRRGASRWLVRERAPTCFYVGRLEDTRATVYLVDHELVRLLFEKIPAPESWAQISDELARRLAAYATGADESPRGGVRRVARRLAKAPPDGFVIERSVLAALAARSPARRWVYRLRAAMPGAHLHRALARHLRARAGGRPFGTRRAAEPTRGGHRGAP